MVGSAAKLVYTTLLYKLNAELADALTKYVSEQFKRSMEVKPVTFRVGRDASDPERSRLVPVIPIYDVLPEP
jgi:hypothetical protein